MPTINSKSMVDLLIRNNEIYEDDKPVKSIVEYTNAWGGVCWGLNYNSLNNYGPSDFVINPKTIFVRKES
jgi:hypothetical protein